MASTIYQPEIPDVSAALVVEAAQPGSGEKSSYGQILKSSVLVGGSQVLNIGIGIFRTKAMAMILGPAGFGLAGLYQSIIDLTQNIAEMGVNSSGVRQIAEAVGSEDSQRIALTTAVLRRTSISLGIAGLAVLVLFSRQISFITFGTPERAAAIGLLGLAVLFRIVSAGQAALLQGMRRIVDLVKMQVLGAIFGVLISVPLVYFLGQRGIVLYLVAVASTTIATSWWYSRKVVVRRPQMTIASVTLEAAALLKLGIAFMLSGMMTLGVAYVVRVILLRKAGMEATGLYQSAWTLGGLYVGFILQAMGADFYPRLTANIRNRPVCNRLVNEQAQVGLLLAVPGVIATLTFAPIVVGLLYSAHFGAAVPVLRWVCLGVLLQVISWPMGFIIVAEGKQNLFIFSEVAWAVVSLGLSWWCIGQFGVVGAGIAFFASYIFHVFLTYAIVSRLTGFRWSLENLRAGSLSLGVVACVFCGGYVMPVWASVAFGACTTILAGVYSVRILFRIVPGDELPRPIRRLAHLLRLPQVA